jgi:hypothetical protein
MAAARVAQSQSVRLYQLNEEVAQLRRLLVLVGQQVGAHPASPAHYCPNLPRSCLLV